MKNVLFTILFVITSYTGIAQNVGIGTNSPNASAVLDASSTTQGFLPPRMTYAQRNGIVNPAAGLIIYCTNCSGGIGEMNYYNGNTWINMSNGTASNIAANLPNVTICNQIWMIKNLDVSTYRNGDVIPKVTNAASCAALDIGAYYYYNNDSATYAAIYGKLYNWYAVNDPRGLAPEGWHIPSDSEWSSLENCLGGSSVAGGAMKEVGTSHWISPNTGATNSSGFSGLSCGYFNCSLGFSFSSFGGSVYWWSSTEASPTHAWDRFLGNNRISADRDANGKTYGFSVRCVKD